MSSNDKKNPEEKKQEVDPAVVAVTLKKIDQMFSAHDSQPLMNELKDIVKALAEEGKIGE